MVEYRYKLPSPPPILHLACICLSCSLPSSNPILRDSYEEAEALLNKNRKQALLKVSLKLLIYFFFCCALFRPGGPGHLAYLIPCISLIHLLTQPKLEAIQDDMVYLRGSYPSIVELCPFHPRNFLTHSLPFLIFWSHADQCITAEVNLARIYNYDVRRRREAGVSSLSNSDLSHEITG
jgi:hypothetical protein